MNNHQKMVLDFHKKYGCAIASIPATPSAHLGLLRSRLIAEEYAEFITAVSNQDIVKVADALCDILYVVYGAAVVWGIDLEPLFKEVHESNMTKTGGGSDFGGKVIKGPNFVPPNLFDRLMEQGFNPNTDDVSPVEAE